MKTNTCLNELSKKTPLQYCVSNGKTLTVLERQIYNGEKPICDDVLADIGENSRSRNVSRELASRILARPRELIVLFLAPFSKSEML